MRDESLHRAEQTASWSRQGCSGGCSRGRPWPQYRPPSGAYVLPAWPKKKKLPQQVDTCSRLTHGKAATEEEEQDISTAV